MKKDTPSNEVRANYIKAIQVSLAAKQTMFDPSPLMCLQLIGLTRALIVFYSSVP